MKTFAYTAQTMQGKEVSGTCEAESYAELVRALQARDLFLVSHQEVAARAARPAATPTPSDAPASAIPAALTLLLLEQILFQLKSGVPLLDALRFIASTNHDRALLRLLPPVIAAVEQGTPFSAALASVRPTIPLIAIRLVQAGEVSGGLEEILDRLIVHLRRQERMKEKIKTAMIYPSLLVFTALGAILLMSLFVLPRFVEFYGTVTLELPLATRGLLAVIHFIGEWKWSLLALAALLLFALVHFLRLVPRSRRAASAVLAVPLVRDIALDLIVTRFCGTLAMMLSNGVPILSAMEIARGVVNNRRLEEDLAAAQEELMNGSGLARSLERHTRLPGMILNLVAVGEQSGRLPEVLEHVSAHYEERTELAMNRLFALSEPALLFVMGAGVAFLALALLMPVFNLATGVN